MYAPLADNVSPLPTAHSSSVSKPLTWACAAFATIVTLLGPRNENWKLSHVS